MLAASTTSDSPLDNQDNGVMDWTQDASEFMGVDPEEQEEEDVDPFDEISQLYNTDEPLGEPLQEGAAALANKALRNHVPAHREKDMLDKYLRPQNCDALQTPRVNMQIWKVLQRRTRETDIQLQKAQTLVHKGLIPLLQALAGLKASKDKVHMGKVLDAFQLLALGAHSLSTTRRQAMANDLFTMFKPLCATSRPVTDLLFGPDQELDQAVKQMKDAQSTGTKLGYGSTMRGLGRGRGGQRGRGQRGNSQSMRGRGRPFLGGKAPHHRRRGAQTKSNNSQSQGARQSDNQQ